MHKNLALVGSDCLSWLGGNRCHQNTVHHRPGGGGWLYMLYIDIHTYIHTYYK